MMEVLTSVRAVSNYQASSILGDETYCDFQFNELGFYVISKYIVTLQCQYKFVCNCICWADARIKY